MANKVLTFVIDTAEADLDHILAAAINEITAAGHTLKQVRVTDDAGEVVVPPNTIAGVTPPEAPAEEPAVSSPSEPPSNPTPDGGETPVDVPVDPTQVESEPQQPESVA